MIYCIYRLLPENGTEVTQRDFHCAVCLKDRVVIFGGRCELTSNISIISSTIYIVYINVSLSLSLSISADLSAPHFSNRDIYDSSFYQYLLG